MSDIQSAVEPYTARLLYQLGSETVRFRFLTEINYASIGAEDGERWEDPTALIPEASEASTVPFDFSSEISPASIVAKGMERWEIPPPPIPVAIETSFGKAIQSSTLLESRHAGAAKIAFALQELFATLQHEWMSDDHRQRLARRSDADLESLRPSEAVLNRIVLGSSCLDAIAWEPLEHAIEEYSKTLSPPLNAVFKLSLALSKLIHPRPSGYDPATQSMPALSPVVRLGTHGPEISRWLEIIRSDIPPLAEMPSLFDDDAAKLHEQLQSILSKVNAPLLSANPPVPADAASPPKPHPALSPVRVDPDEDIAELLALKKRMDPKDTYIGQSLAVLRLFQRIEDLNRLSDLRCCPRIALLERPSL